MDRSKVLIVDDEKDFLEAIVARFRLRGFAAQGASDGQAALDNLGMEPPEVVVLDLKMPGLDGLEVLRCIKRDHPKVEVVILTGHGSPEAGMEGVSLGAFAYLVKPVKISELVEKVEEALEWRRSALHRTDVDG